MTRVLLTGMSGTGKSTVIQELGARGFRAFDADYDGLSIMIDVPPDEQTGLEPGQDWVLNEDRVQKLLSDNDSATLFLSACAPNQGKFYPQFDHIILLTAPATVIVERLANRTNNPYGKRPEEVARALKMLETVEPMLRRGATAIIDTTIPLDHVISLVLQIAGEAR